ncbi:response regulator, partial [Pseudomonas aeruginosa]
MTDMPATADEPVRLLLVDDHPMMRKGVAQLLELEDDLSVVGEAGSGEEALRLAAEL